jgi:transcriptional regulator with XRE-family HTH domain
MSLRELSAQSGIEFSRLSRMEHGTRPAPGLPQLRRLAELLSLNLVDLLVSAGTPREAVEQLLWVERLQQAKRVEDLADFSPRVHPAGLKNQFTMRVLERDGAMCKARLGSETWTVMTFSNSDRLRVRIPPESIHVFADDPTGILLSDCNVFRTRIVKARRVGSLLNLVLDVGGVELNALLAQAASNVNKLNPGNWVHAAISPAALATEPLGVRKGSR